MTIIGRITRDAEVRAVGKDKQVVSFSLAVNDSYRNKQGERVQLTEYYDCSYWRAVGVADYLTRGTQVVLTGWATARAWTGKDGEPRAGLNFNTSVIQFLGGGRRDEAPRERDTAGVQGKAKPQGGKQTAEDDLPF